MPIMQAFFRSLGKSGQTRYIPSSIPSSLPRLALSLFLSLPLRLPQSLICSSCSLLARERRGGPTETGYAVSQPAADVPGGALLSAEVLNKESLGSRSWRTSCKSVCPQITPSPPVMVLASALSHCPTSSLIHPLLQKLSRKKQ